MIAAPPPHTPSVYLAIRVDDHVLCFKNIHLHYITPIKIVLHLPDFLKFFFLLVYIYLFIYLFLLNIS